MIIVSVQKMLIEAWPEWDLVREIGAGSQGSVYMIKHQGSDDSINNYAALKVIAVLRDIQMSEGKGEYPYSAELMTRDMNHPNIVSVKDWKITSDPETGNRFLLMRMELLLPLDEYRGFDIVKVGTDICSALSALHERGIFHLDIKPGNIFVNQEGVFKLGDFGTARNVFDLDKGDFPVGTLHYAAPEVLSTRSVMHTATDAIHADIYSLGMVLFELLIWEEYGRGCHGPADEAHEREEWFQLQSRNYMGYSTFTGAAMKKEECSIKEVVRKALSSFPYLRYEDAEKMREALLRAAEAEGRNENPVHRGSFNKDMVLSVEDSMKHFIYDDVRSVLLLKYSSGVHRRYAGYPYVGKLAGLRLTYVGHEPPERVCLNGDEIMIKPRDGFVDLIFKDIYKERLWPSKVDIAVQYPQGDCYCWSLLQAEPGRHREWFKRPDWT